MKLEYSKDLTARMLTVSGESPTSGQFYLQAVNKVSAFTSSSFLYTNHCWLSCHFVYAQLTDNSQNLYNEVTFRTTNGQWAAVSLIGMYPTKPAINLSYTSPEGNSKFIMNFEEKVKNYWIGNADISWIHGGDGYFKGDGEMKLDSYDDIIIKLNVDAPILQLNNLALTGSNKASGDVKKKIKFDAKMRDVPLVSARYD